MGNLTRDPDVRTVGVNAVKVCRFSLALNERRRDRSGNLIECPVFVEVDAWEKLGELCGQYLRKGRSVLVEGRLQSDVWEKDGVKIQKLKIRAATVKFMPLPAPNQSRLTGEPLAPYPSQAVGDGQNGELDSYEAD
jgi:single-strand DNA-binding protein